MKYFIRVMRGFRPACVFLVMAAGACGAQKVAITFDDLPLNGDLSPGLTRVEITRNTLAVLQKRPCACGVWIRECQEIGRECGCRGGVEVVGRGGTAGKSYI